MASLAMFFIFVQGGSLYVNMSSYIHENVHQVGRYASNDFLLNTTIKIAYSVFWLLPAAFIRNSE